MNTTTNTDDLSTHDLVDEKEAARILGRSHRTLQRWRQLGTGPATVKFGGHIRYSRRGINAFLARLAQEAYEAEMARNDHRGS